MKTVNYIINLQTEEGFNFDKYKAKDLRQDCSAIAALHLLYLQKNKDFNHDSLLKPTPVEFYIEINFDYKKAIKHLLSCNNYDGGFSQIIGSESHLAYVFCGVCSLYYLGCKDYDYLNCEDFILRRIKDGGFSGRVDKNRDLCYSFWAIASLKMLNCNDFDSEKAFEYILTCENQEGGFGHCKGRDSDLYHTCFALNALAFLKPGLFKKPTSFLSI